MERRRLPAEDPREWLNRARSSLAHARSIQHEVYFEELCFDAQQAAEKAIKAVMSHFGMAFPYSRDVRIAERVLRWAERHVAAK